METHSEKLSRIFLEVSDNGNLKTGDRIAHTEYGTGTIERFGYDDKANEGRISIKLDKVITDKRDRIMPFVTLWISLEKFKKTCTLTKNNNGHP